MYSHRAYEREIETSGAELRFLQSGGDSFPSATVDGWSYRLVHRYRVVAEDEHRKIGAQARTLRCFSAIPRGTGGLGSHLESRHDIV